MDVSDIKGLVIIDLWNIAIVDRWFEEYKHKLNFEKFDSIIVANYELALDSNDISQYNVLKDYSWTNYTPELLLPIMKEARDQQTYPGVQANLNSNSFLILTPEGMQRHVEYMVPHVNDWLIVGNTWGMCTHNRPLGFHAMKSMPYNFYITDWSIIGAKQNSIEHIKEDSLSWIDCGNNLFQLKNDDTR